MPSSSSWELPAPTSRHTHARARTRTRASALTHYMRRSEVPHTHASSCILPFFPVIKLRVVYPPLFRGLPLKPVAAAAARRFRVEHLMSRLARADKQAAQARLKRQGHVYHKLGTWSRSRLGRAYHELDIRGEWVENRSSQCRATAESAVTDAGPAGRGTRNGTARARPAASLTREGQGNLNFSSCSIHSLPVTRRTQARTPSRSYEFKYKCGPLNAAAGGGGFCQWIAASGRVGRLRPEPRRDANHSDANHVCYR